MCKETYKRVACQVCDTVLYIENVCVLLVLHCLPCSSCATITFHLKVIIIYVVVSLEKITIAVLTVGAEYRSLCCLV